MKTLLILVAGILLPSLRECLSPADSFVPVSSDQVRVRRQAPTVNVHKIPKTSFTCNGKKSGEYYADPETRCQVYHVCVPGFNGKFSSMSFVCPNGTVFNQANRVCSPYDRVDCALAERFYESLHGDPNQHRKDYDGPTGPTTPPHPRHSRPHSGTGHSARPHPPPPPPPPPPTAPRSRQSGRPTPRSRQSRPAAAPATPAPVRTSRPNVSRVPPPDVPRGGFTSTSTSSYEYDYEYEYEDEPENNRNKREAETFPTLPRRFFPASPVSSDFACDDKVAGGTYADPGSECRTFHLCVPVDKGKLRDYLFSCGQGSAFDQRSGECRPPDSFDCSRSSSFYKIDKTAAFSAGKKVGRPRNKT
ncbi:ENHANCER OF AG-4 protein 2-like [Centruroides sculpturatus]|uniref:ENHANCER OF AG-4 protein 2-like n=1 Tax=Centruroides sculpturatus TaxID=218467 RepID=UPI000C6CAE18|nr:ENHANCER OF AG-4 protein 2-like [Centruroides sculpturatus]